VQEIATVDKQQANFPSIAVSDRLGRASRDRAETEALARERRRIAADVHDLVMQDLASALASARSLADAPDPVASSSGQAQTIVVAAERAFAGARRVVEGLVAQDRRPVVESVEDSVCLAARHVPLSFDAGGVRDEAQPDGPTLDALVHIGREAVTNAVKHADPSGIEVVLEHADEWRLLIRDDGKGCDLDGPDRDGPDLHGPGGFGLASMRRHAQMLGGLLIVVSEPGGGTTVEAVLP
jgi:two-component system, NarL family, sensor kinase